MKVYYKWDFEVFPEIFGRLKNDEVFIDLIFDENKWDSGWHEMVQRMLENHMNKIMNIYEKMSEFYSESF